MPTTSETRLLGHPRPGESSWCTTNRAAARTCAGAHGRREVGRAAQPNGSRQHVAGEIGDACARQAESSPRPLRRRADTMPRPARVRIRSRKPWVFARRRLFGWKVRLLTGGLSSYERRRAGHAGVACNGRQRYAPVRHKRNNGTDHPPRGSNCDQRAGRRTGFAAPCPDEARQDGHDTPGSIVHRPEPLLGSPTVTLDGRHRDSRASRRSAQRKAAPRHDGALSLRRARAQSVEKPVDFDDLSRHVRGCVSQHQSAEATSTAGRPRGPAGPIAGPAQPH